MNLRKNKRKRKVWNKQRKVQIKYNSTQQIIDQMTEAKQQNKKCNRKDLKEQQQQR